MPLSTAAGRRKCFARPYERRWRPARQLAGVATVAHGDVQYRSAESVRVSRCRRPSDRPTRPRTDTAVTDGRPRLTPAPARCPPPGTPTRRSTAAELDAVFRRGWSCVGVVDDIAPTQRVPGGRPRPRRCRCCSPDRRRATLRGVPQRVPPPWRPAGRGLRDGAGAGVPLPRAGSTGSTARWPAAIGMEGAEDFDPLDHSLYPVCGRHVGPVRVRQPRPDAAPFDLGPLAAALDPYAVDGLRAVVREEHERAFNWKVLVENYSENFHTPFVHPELIVNGWDYPIVTEGAIIAGVGPPAGAAEPRPRGAGHGAAGRRRAGHEVASDQIDDVFIAGVYFTVFPNLLVSAFPRYLSAFCADARSATRTSARVDYLRVWHPSVRRRAPGRRPRGEPGRRRPGPRHLRGGAARLHRRHRHRRAGSSPGARDRCRPRPRAAAAGHRRRWLTVTSHRAPSWVGCAWCARRASRSGATRSWRPPASS